MIFPLYYLLFIFLVVICYVLISQTLIELECAEDGGLKKSTQRARKTKRTNYLVLNRNSGLSLKVELS